MRVIRSVFLRYHSVLFILFPLVFGCAAGSAQGIVGTVFDPDGGVMPKSRVMLMQDYVKIRETAADERGAFAFTDLAEGRYQLQIKHPMFSLFQQTLDLKGTEPARVHAILPLGRMTDGIRIDARLAPGVERRTSRRPAAARQGGKVEPAKLLKISTPVYPPGADARGVEGPVVIFATIRADGSVADPVVICSPEPEFEGESVAAVKRWRYRPMMLNGRAVETQVTITLQYHLQ